MTQKYLAMLPILYILEKFLKIVVAFLVNPINHYICFQRLNFYFLKTPEIYLYWTKRVTYTYSVLFRVWARNFQFGLLGQHWEFLSFGTGGFGGLLWRFPMRLGAKPRKILPLMDLHIFYEQLNFLGLTLGLLSKFTFSMLKVT